MPVTGAPSEMLNFSNRWSSHFARWTQRAEEEFQHDEARIGDNLKAGKLNRGLGAALDCLTSGGRVLAYSVAAGGKPADVDLTRKVIHYGMWGWACMLERATREAPSPFNPTGYERGLLWLYCLTTACRMTEASDWLKLYVSNAFVSGAMDGGAPPDIEFNNAFWLLSKSATDQKWHSASKPDEPLGLYEPLFAATDDAGIAQAAAAVCERIVDVRMNGTLNADGSHSVYQEDPWGVLPLDLVAFREIRRSVTHESLGLGDHHPLLLSPYTSFPDLSNFDFRADIPLLSNAARSEYGANWEPWPKLPDLSAA